VMTPSANSCITSPVADSIPISTDTLNVTVYITPSMKECSPIPSAAVMPNSSSFCLVWYFIISFEKNMNRNPPRAMNPAYGLDLMALGSASVRGVDIRIPAAKHMK